MGEFVISALRCSFRADQIIALLLSVARSLFGYACGSGFTPQRRQGTKQTPRALRAMLDLGLSPSRHTMTPRRSRKISTVFTSVLLGLGVLYVLESSRRPQNVNKIVKISSDIVIAGEEVSYEDALHVGAYDPIN